MPKKPVCLLRFVRASENARWPILLQSSYDTSCSGTLNLVNQLKSKMQKGCSLSSCPPCIYIVVLLQAAKAR